MTNENDPTTEARPGVTVDLSSIAKLGTKRLVNHLFEILINFSRKQRDNKQPFKGALIVLGAFAKHNYQVPGIRQIRDNPITELTFVTDENGVVELEKLFEYDGAIVIDRTGQILCARAYLVVDEAALPIEEECNTRHLTAASFSLRPDVVACFTVSEETGKVRLYEDGKQEDVFDPHERHQTQKHS